MVYCTSTIFSVVTCLTLRAIVLVFVEWSRWQSWEASFHRDSRTWRFKAENVRALTTRHDHSHQRGAPFVRITLSAPSFAAFPNVS